MQIEITDRTLLKMMTGVLAFNTGCLVHAMFEFRKYEKTIVQWKKNHEYMTRFSRGMAEIAIRNADNPRAAKAEIDALMEDIQAEILIDEIDFSSVLKEEK